MISESRQSEIWGYPLDSGGYYMLCPLLGSPDVLNDLAIGSRIDSHGILQETVKQLPTMSGSPSIETKRKFVQVVLNMFRADCSLMSTQYPAL